jgi:hypothetical protein
MHSIGGQKAKYRLPSGLLASPVQNILITIAAGQNVGTATINPVNVGSTELSWGNWRSAEGTVNPAEDFARVTLTNSRTVTATRNTANASDSCIVAVSVIPWKPSVARVIYGTLVMSAATQTDQAITSVDTTRSYINFLGCSHDQTTYNLIRNHATIFIQSATNVRADKGNFAAGDNMTISFCVTEFAKGILKRLQTAEVTIPGGATTGSGAITAVVTANTFLRFGGFRQAVLGNSDKRLWPYAELTDTTTITATRNTVDATSTSLIRVYVAEFFPGLLRKVTRSAEVIASGNLSATGTIASQDTQHTIATFLGATTNTNSTSDAPWATVSVDSKTAIGNTRGSSPATTVTNSWEAFEL